MRCRLSLILAIVLAGIPLAAAQDPAIPATQAGKNAPPARAISAAEKPSREQLVKLFEVMRIRSQMEEMLKMVPEALQQQLQNEEENVELNNLPGSGQLTPEQRAAEDKVTKKYIQLTVGLYPMNEMVNDMVGVYQRHLSREDVDGIIAFYRSTPGQHILDAQPLMAKEVMPAVTKKLEARGKELLERYNRELNEVLGPPKIPAPEAAPKS